MITALVSTMRGAATMPQQPRPASLPLRAGHRRRRHSASAMALRSNALLTRPKLVLDEVCDPCNFACRLRMVRKVRYPGDARCRIPCKERHLSATQQRHLGCRTLIIDSDSSEHGCLGGSCFCSVQIDYTCLVWMLLGSTSIIRTQAVRGGVRSKVIEVIVH